MATINKFDGEYRWLSNFYEPCHITVDGIIYRCSEAAYQALKTLNINERLIISGMNASQSKKAGRRLALRSDWEQVKDLAMRIVVRAKFTQHPELRDKLIATKDAKLVEENWWGDVYWGVSNGKGLNKLGVLLMEIRAEMLNGTF